jgi:hypothetical protein
MYCEGVIMSNSIAQLFRWLIEWIAGSGSDPSILDDDDITPNRRGKLPSETGRQKPPTPR